MHGLTADVGAWARATTRRANRFGWWVVWACAPRRGLEAFVRLYAYFRWADDIVDAPGRDPAEVARFVAGQAALRAGERPAAGPAEAALVEALAAEPRLRAAADTMAAALAFDARRTSESLAPADAEAQVVRVGDAFLGALWVCLGEPGAPPPELARLARGATRAHLLRDREVDEALGYVNRPAGPDGRPVPVAAWAAATAAAARADFAAGRAALSGVGRWRTRLVLRLWAWRYASRLAAWAAAPSGVQAG